MATFKIVVQKKRKDGFYTVYIRLTHNREVCYIKTDKVVNDKGLVSGTKDVKDTFVLNSLMSTITRWVEKLNHVDIAKWPLEEVRRYIELDERGVSFSQFAKEYIHELYNTLEPGTVGSYYQALRCLEKYAESEDIMFSQLTVNFVEGWIKSLSTSRAIKFSYPTLIKKIFLEGVKAYNDYDNNIVHISNNPWPKIAIPKIDRSDKKAITMEECRIFFAVEPRTERQRLVLDVCKMILCLAGINVADLYYLQKDSYYDGILHYQRRKTKKRRDDHAYIEMRVPDMLIPTLEKYLSDDDDEYLFKFHKLYPMSSFNVVICNQLREICSTLLNMKDGKHYTPYTFRHTWATIAQNDVGASYEEVGFALNHISANHVTMGYVKPDFSRAWELNEKVVEKIFFSNEKSRRLTKNVVNRFENVTSRMELKAVAYYMGEIVGECSGKGYVNLDEIVTQVMCNLNSDVPAKCTIQIKVINVSNNQTKFFERRR